MRRFAEGLAAGFWAGYALVRMLDALRDRRSPFPTLEPDAAAYGAFRRRLMLAGIARSFASTAALALVAGPAVEGRAAPTRLRRMALLAAGAALSALIELPGDYVEGHVLERQYALSKQPARDWLRDRLKAEALGIAITTPLLELLAALIGRAPKRWPFAAVAAAPPLLVLANVIAPLYIMPLFNRFEPLEGALAERLRELAARYGAGDARILRVDMSRQTEKANAYVTGLFGTHRIVVGDTLLEHFTGDETTFVVAHELGHYVHRDVWRSVALGTAAAALVAFGAQRAARLRPGRVRASDLGRLALAGSAIGLALGPLMAYASRERERAADRFALAATADPTSGVAAFTRLRERNLAEDEQPAWARVLFATHPSLRERIDTLAAAAH